MDKRKGNVTLCWVPGHAGTTGNEEADEEAKRALEESIPNDGNCGQSTKKVGRGKECNEREKEEHELAK
jgi:ribonuclease HI